MTLSFKQPQSVTSLRLCFDPDFTRESISENKKMRVFAMKLHTGLDFKSVSVASTLVKDFVVYIDGKEFKRVENNFHRIVNIVLDTDATSVSIKWLATHGAPRVRLFSVDIAGTANGRLNDEH